MSPGRRPPRSPGWFFWTPWFLVISAGCIGTAAVLAWMDREQLAQPLAQSVRWEVLWSLAVFTWRLTVVGSLANLLAWGVVSVSGIRFVGLVLRTVFKGSFAGEFSAMIANRRRRAAAWVFGLGALPAVLARGWSPARGGRRAAQAGRAG